MQFFNQGNRSPKGRTIISVCALALVINHAFAGSLEQAKRMHDRLTGIPASEQVLLAMQQLVEAGDTAAAANLAMQNPAFYDVTLKQFVTPWTNEEFDVFAPLNDYTALVVGLVRDDIDFRQVLSGDILYIGDPGLGLPGYQSGNNLHFEAFESQGHSLATGLVQGTQSNLIGLPVAATAGVMTTRAAAKSFFKDGTNRAMLRFTLMNHLCTDLEGLKDNTLPPDRIRQDLSRSPGGDSRIFINNCVGCHAGMDPLAQAFAYYNYDYNIDADPEGINGSIVYNDVGQTDASTGLRVQAKYWINANNFPYGFATPDDRWDNYWRAGVNQLVGWSAQLPGYGNGAKSLGEELANSQQFASCQVTKVFENVCLRAPQDQLDRDAVTRITQSFKQNGYRLKQVFAESAEYCMGE